MYLDQLPTEILYAIFQDVAEFGSSHLVAVTRASRGLHAISNSILYSTDIRESGGLKSTSYGLKTGLNNVVKLCLSAGVDPDLRFESREDLDSHFPPISRTASHRPEESDGATTNFPSRDSHLENGRIAHSPSLSEDPGNEVFDLVAGGNRPFQSDQAFYWTPLHLAATRDDIELLSLLLDHGASPNSAGRGVCPCHRAPLRRTLGRSAPSREQNYSELLERRIVTRWSPLHVAVCKGSLDCAEELVRRFGLAHAVESDDAVLAEARRFFRDEPALSAMRDLFPDVFDEMIPRFDPLSPLHVAADRFASVDALERVYAMLEKAGCLEGLHSGVDVLDAFGDTPFAVAAFSGRIHILGSWLRDHGAEINFALHDLDGQRRSVINAMCESSRYSDALSLMDFGFDIHGDTELHSGDGHGSALHQCCGYDVLSNDGRLATEKDLNQRGATAIVLIKRLIHAGADVNARAEDGITALMSAAHLGFPAAVRELLEAEADVGAVNDDGDYALRYAVARGLHFKPGPELSAALVTMQLLLDYGADPNQRSKNRGPPLFTRRYDLVGSPAVEFAIFGWLSTPSDIAQNSMVSIAPLLIANGADPNMYLEDPRDFGEGNLEEQLDNFGGRSLAVSAFYMREFDSLDSLIASGTVITPPDYHLMMRSFLDSKIESNGRTSAAAEALFRVLNCPSMRFERPEDRKSIMDAWTEVLYLAVGSRPRLVRALAPHICLTNMCGPGGKTVLHLMAQWERKKNERPELFDKRIAEMMVDLIRCGAGRQINQPDDSGRSPLRLAVDRGNIAVARQLIGLGASMHLEHRMPDGSTTISPLRSAIRNYSKARQFKMAANILEASSSIHGSTDRLCGNLGLLKDLILHFGGNAFDKPSRISLRTAKLMEALFGTGVSVNESDEHGNTALHHLIQQLYPSDEGYNESGNLQDVYPSQSPGYAARSSVSIKCPGGMHTERLFDLSEEQDMHLNGHNLIYDSDSDCDSHPDKYDQPDYDIFEDDSDSSDDMDNEETFPPNELGELVNHSPGLASHRCDAWMSLFFFLLVHGASITMKNTSGKAAVDYIDELMDCEPHACRKMYRPVIPALREFVKRPPFDPELLATLDDSRAEAKGTPVLFVHDQIHLSMDENGPEQAREVERQARARGETCWVPFWHSSHTSPIICEAARGYKLC